MDRSGPELLLVQTIASGVPVRLRSRLLVSLLLELPIGLAHPRLQSCSRPSRPRFSPVPHAPPTNPLARVWRPARPREGASRGQCGTGRATCVGYGRAWWRRPRCAAPSPLSPDVGCGRGVYDAVGAPLYGAVLLWRAKATRTAREHGASKAPAGRTFERLLPSAPTCSLRRIIAFSATTQAACLVSELSLCWRAAQPST